MDSAAGFGMAGAHLYAAAASRVRKLSAKKKRAGSAP
jgi:hypothetical protein